jgi:hypothetical protein
MADPIHEAIAAALADYRCRFTTMDEEGTDGLPLVDKLTPPDQTSIDLGLQELEALADHIYDALPDGVSASPGKEDPQQTPMEEK